VLRKEALIANDPTWDEVAIRTAMVRVMFVYGLWLVAHCHVQCATAVCRVDRQCASHTLNRLKAGYQIGIASNDWNQLRRS
jgi:hypothetical protein